MINESIPRWAPLHDAYERFTSSVCDRTVNLSVHIGHLPDDPQNGRGSRFEIRLSLVRGVHVAA